MPGTKDRLHGAALNGRRRHRSVPGGWIFSAALDYTVNIANAATQQVAVLARPHLTTLSGTPATFLAGGEIVFKVSGINSGDIKPYPFGTTLKVTPTLLRAVGEDGRPQVYISVEAGRTSVLDLLSGSRPWTR